MKLTLQRHICFIPEAFMGSLLESTPGNERSACTKTGRTLTKEGLATYLLFFPLLSHLPLAMSQPQQHDQLEAEEKAKIFSKTLARVDKERLPQLAADILSRQKGFPTSIPSVGEPLFGSFNVFFPLSFDRGRWLVKIPMNGTPEKWDELSASALTSEAEAMRFLKRRTTIPLAEVLDFSATTENAIRCPYIIMTFIEGFPLYNVWFGSHIRDVDADITRSRCIRALKDIAAAMNQLGQFSFPSSGQPVFENGVCGVGSMRVLDVLALLDRYSVEEDPDEDPIYIESAVSSDPKHYFTFLLDKHPEQSPVPQGLVLLLRRLISWIPEPKPDDMDPFVLAHPGFDIENIIVSEEGELRVSSTGKTSPLSRAAQGTRGTPVGSRGTGTRACTGIQSRWIEKSQRVVYGKTHPGLLPTTVVSMKDFCRQSGIQVLSDVPRG